MDLRARLIGWAGSALLLISSSGARADKVDAYIRHAMARAHVPGVAVVVLQAGKPPKIAAYGTADIEGSVPVTRSTAFQLASATKLFTGILLMRMVQEGRLALSDPISKYIENVPPAWRGITVLQLASHSSGFPDAVNAGPFSDIYAVRDWAARQPPLAAPGVQSIYSQTEFALLTEILQKVSGRSFDTLLKQEIIAPLGLTTTRYSYLNDISGDPGTAVVSAKLVPGRATIYRWSGTEQLRYEYTYPNWTHANAGLYSSAADLAKLLIALQGDKLLDAASKRALGQAYRLKNGKTAPFGAAWATRRWRNRLAMGHSGGPGLSDIWIYPERKLAVAILVNSHTIFPVLADQIAEIVDPAPPPRRARIPDADPVLSRKLETWTSRPSIAGSGRTLIASESAPAMASLLSLLAPTVAAFGTPKSWHLVAESTDVKSNRSRTYAASYGVGELIWTFQLSAKGQIVSAFATPD